VLVLRLSKRVESPRKHREIMINYLRKNQRTGELFTGICFRRAPIYRWMVRNRSKYEKALFLIRGIGLTVEFP